MFRWLPFRWGLAACALAAPLYSPSSRPRLPAGEEGGVSGRDPLFVDPDRGDFAVKAESPARKAGAQALPGAGKASR